MKELAHSDRRSTFEQVAETSRARSTLAADPQLGALMGAVDAIAEAVFRRLGRRIELEELRGVGYLAAWECRQRYDPAVGASIITYAWLRIEGAMLDRARKERWFNEIRYAVGAHAEGMREALDVSDQDAAWGPAGGAQANWAAQAVGRAAIFAMARRAFDPAAASDECERWELNGLLDRCMNQLPDEQKQVLRRLWVDGWSLAEIGDELGVSKQWARRLNMKAIDNMRRMMSVAPTQEDDVSLLASGFDKSDTAKKG